jgi:hypothetical protein
MKNFLFEAIKRLAEAKIDFVICGGVAGVLHGSDRNTMDLDIYFNMSEDNLKKLIEVAKQEDWTPRNPEPLDNLLDPQKRQEWMEEKNAIVYTLQSREGLLQIDVFLNYPIGFGELSREADIFDIEGIRFKVSSIPHLIKAKRSIEPKRRQDIYDIQVLEELNHAAKKKKGD